MKREEEKRRRKTTNRSRHFRGFQQNWSRESNLRRPRTGDEKKNRHQKRIGGNQKSFAYQKKKNEEDKGKKSITPANPIFLNRGQQCFFLARGEKETRFRGRSTARDSSAACGKMAVGLVYHPMQALTLQHLRIICCWSFFMFGNAKGKSLISTTPLAQSRKPKACLTNRTETWEGMLMLAS
ncbi:hypothetical protein TRIATDRAFT_300976 [Trichoderma atroviride IMI 206040]|uniref:Uncharacterized protein n=1 Tax=Hypocrea atroviridis (strain ATCC 20476 / IMI 206040) TaxID=452589 RepID=G9P3N9_HYPAI|nr:uncharacterized protein TRIATDRAFT_300976 [Trichoderma atroviride IMI 206040]EHK42996.1 hypothetical protein TRIATDRAFT_300976 [Trichoderma atroviride IMI 206040]